MFVLLRPFIFSSGDVYIFDGVRKKKPTGYLLLFQAENPTDFGNSWAIDEEQCNPVTEPPTPCAVGSDDHDKAVDLCHALVNETGW